MLLQQRPLDRGSASMKPARLARLAGTATIAIFWFQSAPAEITVTTWAGPYLDSQQKAYGATWKNGGNANIDWHTYRGGLDSIRNQIESGDVTWDVVDVLPSDARVGCAEALFAKLDRDVFEGAPGGTPMDEELVIDLPNDCVVPNVIWSYVVFYDQKRFPDAPPSTKADFFDVERFPGKRSIQVRPRGILEMALVADGVAPAKVCEVMGTASGIDRGFDKLEGIREHTVFWSAYDAPLRKSAFEVIREGEPWYHTGESLVPYLPTRPDSPDRAIVVDPEWWTEHRPAI